MAKAFEIVNVRLPLLDERFFYTVGAKDGSWIKIERQPEQVRRPNALSLKAWNVRDPSREVAAWVLDAGGAILLPGLVDAHMHLDKAFSLPRVGNDTGTLEEAVRNYAASSHMFTKEEIKSRIERAALQALSYGTTAIRTHLDFQVRAGRDVALRTIEAALEVKEALAPYLTLQLFPMCPFNLPPEQGLDVVEEALRLGVDGLGGAPHLSLSPAEEIAALFRLADRYGCPIDLHTDESDDPNVRTLAHIASLTGAFGFGGRVTVDHLCSLAAMPDADAGALIQAMADAGLKAVTLPGANMYLQGRHDGFPARRGVTRIKELLAAGIPLATASDNIHDPFHPFGRGDLIQIGLVTAYAAHMGSPADLRTLLRMMTELPAEVLGLEDYGIRAGARADAVLVDAKTPEELFTLLPERRWVCRSGSWLRTAPSRGEWREEALASLWTQASQAVSFETAGPVEAVKEA